MIKNITILGAGESGVGSAILAKKNSYEVFVSDNGLIDMETKKKFNGLNIDFEENSHELAKCTDIDFVIKSFSKMIGGEIFIPVIPSIKITDLAKAMAPKIKQKIL